MGRAIQPQGADPVGEAPRRSADDARQRRRGACAPHRVVQGARTAVIRSSPTPLLWPNATVPRRRCRSGASGCDARGPPRRAPPPCSFGDRLPAAGCGATAPVWRDNRAAPTRRSIAQSRPPRVRDPGRLAPRAPTRCQSARGPRGRAVGPLQPPARGFGIRGLSGRCGAIPPRLEGVFLRRRPERLDLFAGAGAGEGVDGGGGVAISVVAGVPRSVFQAISSRPNRPPARSRHRSFSQLRALHWRGCCNSLQCRSLVAPIEKRTTAHTLCPSEQSNGIRG